MEKAKQRIQSEDIRNASIIPKWNDICSADMNKLAEMPCPNLRSGTI